MFDDVGATVRITVAGVTSLRFDLAKCFAALTLMTVPIRHVLRTALQDRKLKVNRLPTTPDVRSKVAETTEACVRKGVQHVRVDPKARLTHCRPTTAIARSCHSGEWLKMHRDCRGIGSLKPHTGFVLPDRSASPFAAAAKDRAVEVSAIACLQWLGLDQFEGTRTIWPSFGP